MYKDTLLTATEVSDLLGISKSYAYKIIQGLNEELKSNGYLTIHGKIDDSYLRQRFFPYHGKETDYGSV